MQFESCIEYAFQFFDAFYLLFYLHEIQSRYEKPTSTIDAVSFRQRPYFVEYTRSHPNSEVKRRKARSVLGWGTAREALRVLLAFLFGLIPRTVYNYFYLRGFQKLKKWAKFEKFKQISSKIVKKCEKSWNFSKILGSLKPWKLAAKIAKFWIC